MARQQSQGTCHLCKGTFPKGSMTRHLTRCRLTHDDAAALAAEGKAKKGKILHLVVEGKYAPEYWLHVEMPATTRMKYLDQVLRDLWLECCGHLSAFTLEGKKRSVRSSPRSMEELLRNLQDDRYPGELDMEDRIGDVVQKGSKLSYEYDFGSTTKLSIKVVGEREGWVVKPNDVHILARNDPPHIPCGRCHKAEATIIDAENSWDRSGWLCARCAEEEGLSDEEMTLPVVNSPRAGVCGYTGT
jgi:hypothetical protein